MTVEAFNLIATLIAIALFLVTPLAIYLTVGDNKQKGAENERQERERTA